MQNQTQELAGSPVLYGAVEHRPQSTSHRAPEQDGDVRTASQPTVSSMDGWILREYEVTDSTNLLAAALQPWEAVRANTQTAGRGRFQRSWVSDQGGLWLSAVVPIGVEPVWKLLPLAAGLAVCEVLRALGVPGLRMRWPNDVLANDRKLAGLLIDQFSPRAAVVGIGLNVRNQPEAHDSGLRNHTARLTDLVPEPPELRELTISILRALRAATGEMQVDNLHALLPRINALWGPPRRVELDLDGDIRQGVFAGVRADGNLILHGETGFNGAFQPWQVRHLQEI